MKQFKSSILLSLIAAAMLCVGTVQAAADVSGAKIVMFRVTTTGSAIITFNKDGVGRPGCASYDNGRSLSIDTNTDAGREVMRVALAGYLAGKTFRFVGLGTCNLQNNKEDLSHIFMD